MADPDRDVGRAPDARERSVTRGQLVAVARAGDQARVLEPDDRLGPRPRLGRRGGDRVRTTVAVERVGEDAVVVVRDALGADRQRAGGRRGDPRGGGDIRRRVAAGEVEAGQTLLVGAVELALVATDEHLGAVGRQHLRAHGRRGAGAPAVHLGSPVAEPTVGDPEGLQAVPDEVVRVVRTDEAAGVLASSRGCASRGTSIRWRTPDPRIHRGTGSCRSASRRPGWLRSSPPSSPGSAPRPSRRRSCPESGCR